MALPSARSRGVAGRIAGRRHANTDERTVRFRPLPQSEPPAAAAREEGRATPGILLVDRDRRSVDQLLLTRCRRAGSTPETATDAATVLSMLPGQRRYGLLITEINTRELDGLALITEARRQQPGLPSIVITANSTESAAIEAANLGVAGYFTKPLVMSRVMAAVLVALGQ